MDLDAFHVLVVLAPYLLLPVAGWMGGRGQFARILALLPAALTGYFAWMFWLVSRAGPLTVTAPWAPELGLSLSFHFDGLGLLFATLVTGIGTLIVLYAIGYLGDHPLAGRFQLTLFAFMGSMLGVVLSDNVLLLFVFWELTGFTSYFLIGFDHERSEARRSAMQALLVTAGGGLALLAAAVLIWQTGDTTSLSELRASGEPLLAATSYSWIVLLILLAAFTKSAQFPFHFWLPNAMEAPTPVSGYLHSATMVKAGVYLVARMTPLLGGTTVWTGLIVAAGALTLLGGAYRSLFETDLKRILAYTTIAALGAMMLLLGVGTWAAIVASLVYLVAHACYKGALFLVAGAVDHQSGTRDVRQLAGLRQVMPLTAAAGMLAALSMAGGPPFIGFVAKEQLYAGVVELGEPGMISNLLLGVTVLASAMMGTAGLIAGFGPFLGSRAEPEGTTEGGFSLWIGPIVLATIGVIIGIVPGVTDRLFTLAAQAVTGADTPVHLVLWHGFTPGLLLSALTLAITLLLYRYRHAIRELRWPRSLRSERLYTGPLGALDSISRRVGPALQSASLRAYVRVIALTAVMLLMTVYFVNGAIPQLTWRTPARAHEVALGILIMVGAIGATRARSAMAAVLSLGTVGYGLALLYVFYGAPDLAATQFAVETLTVVLFVLVFYELRGFGSEMSRLASWRDLAISAIVGVSLGLLVLTAANAGITSRLADYFVKNAPTLAHGNNVVNVILVDFRSLDTMGEITVLVTVAIGVRALLRIGKRELRG